MMATLRKYLIAGLLVWLPLAATVGIIKLVIDLLDKLILLLPVSYQPDTYIPGLGLLLAIGVLVLTGMLAANLLGRQLVSLWEAILSRIPIVRNIYNAVKQIASTVLTSKGKSFRKVVLAEYPRKGIWSIGFLTNEEVAFDCKELQGNMVAVFLPTTPNPTSGFILMFSKEDLIELDMSVEEGFKFIISIGVVVPEGPIKESLLTTS
ncbi:MAG: DUF502 domain-containing protein [Gammaproteobacteria bacterium]|jgi:uncharacterized membrane protein|nr:DUF502 domain-containing protein [Gammaproteobacteria bacterium]